MDLYVQNLKSLREFDSELAERVSKHSPSEEIEVVSSKSGFLVPQVSGVSLHSQYKPVEEATRAIENFVFDSQRKTIVYGLGFGYHVQALLQRHSGEVIIIEPLMSLFRSFMASIDIRPFLGRVRFRVAETPACLIARLEQGNWNIFRHMPSVRLAGNYYNRLDAGQEIKILLNDQSLRVMIVNPVYGGSLPTAHHCASALRSLGHEVATVDCDEFSQGFHSLKKITRNPKNSEVLSQNFMKLMGEITAAKADDFKPDIIIALAQAPLTPEAIQKLKALKIPVVFWFVEDFRTLSYWNEIATDYDYIFTIQDETFHQALRDKGAQNCYYLPQACSTAIHRPLELSVESLDLYGADLSFMGAAYHNRVQSFPRLMNFDFKIWGTGWNLESPLGRLVQNDNQLVTTEETVKIYNAAKVNLNLHSSTYHYGIHPDGDFVNPRTFEIAACRGFQLVDKRTHLSRMFKLGEEMIVFDSLGQMQDQIEYYLTRPDERHAIAHKSYQRVLNEHTMEHRMQELLIHVFLDHKTILNRERESQIDPLDYCIEKAGEQTDLGNYLKQFKGQNPFSLKTVTEHIHKGEGALDDKETLFLMLDQLLKEEV